MKSLHLIDNRLVYIVPGLIGAFNVIIVKNFFQSIPDSLQEAAKIDGANEFYIFYKVILPLSTPVLATIALWTAVGQWNSWFDAMIYINNDSKQVLPIFLQRLIMQDSSQFIELGITNPDKLSFSTQTIKAATIVVTILPIMCVYPFLQKYFVKGIMIGSTKG
jgi:putative aldouronate transport system permease protein